MHEQNQHASSIRPLKNNFVRMKSEKRLLVVLNSLVSGKHSALMIAQNKVRKTQTKLLKKADVLRNHSPRYLTNLFTLSLFPLMK